jgi:hypothetical protein
MGQINTREICLLGPTTATGTQATNPDINLIQGWQAATITLNVQTVSGTSPTLDVYIQKKLGQASFTNGDVTGGFPTGTAIYDDVVHFAQVTASNTIRIVNLCTGPGAPTANSSLITSADYANSVAGLSASNLRVGPIGGLWKVSYVIGGTSPSFAFSVVAQMIPFST